MQKTRIAVEGIAQNSCLPSNASHGWRVDRPGGIVFVGGQISADRNGAAVDAGNLEAQVRNVFRDIERVLHDGRASWQDVVRLDAYYVLDGGMDVETYWDTVSRVSSGFLSEAAPVWTAVQVPGLAYPGLLIEVDAVAVVSDEK